MSKMVKLNKVVKKSRDPKLTKKKVSLRYSLAWAYKEPDPFSYRLYWNLLRDQVYTISISSLTYVTCDDLTSSMIGLSYIGSNADVVVGIVPKSRSRKKELEFGVAIENKVELMNRGKYIRGVI